MNPAARTWLTHGAGVLLGIALAAAAVAFSGGTLPRPTVRPDYPLEEAPPRPGRPETATRKAGADRPVAGAEAMGPKDFRDAWEAIAFRKLTVDERVELQRMVLEKWTRVDLRGALRAVYDGPWSSTANAGGIEALADVFQEAFAADPLDAWEVLHSPEFSRGAALFHKPWSEGLSGEHAEVVLSLLGRMPEDITKMALSKVMDGVAEAQRVELMGRLVELPPEMQAERWIPDLMGKLPLSQEGPETLRGNLVAAETEAQRARALIELAAVLAAGDSTVMTEEWGKLPEEWRNRVAEKLLDVEMPAQNLPAALEMITRSGQWTLMMDWKMEQYIPQLDDVELPGWAEKIPAHRNTESLFHDAAKAYIDRNPAAAHTWIEGMEPGWHRDHALMAYLEVSGISAEQAEKALELLETIRDPEFRAGAEEHRAKLEKAIRGE